MRQRPEPHPKTLLYLDQNHASRINKFLLGQGSHEHFGVLYRALDERRVLIPPSPFHVLELRSGYLLPPFKTFYARFSQGLWVRPWQEVVRRQTARGGLHLDDLLTPEGSWERPARLEPLEDILVLELSGSLLERSWGAKDELCERLELSTGPTPPFVRWLSRLLAFRSLERERYDRPSDLIDLIMAATLSPYVDVLATDRYMREVLERVGYRGEVYSGRRHEVLALAARLARAQV